MGSWTLFMVAYLLGGLTFIPLVVVAVLLHAHYTFPVHDKSALGAVDHANNIIQPGDDTIDLDAFQREEKEKEKERVGLKQPFAVENDVAAGYFAVCREYKPMGINAKPIERSTPVGSTTVAPPSPSVYQSMYRSIFDRKQTLSPFDDNKNTSQRPKKAGNVFYVVLRHGHLMLFDDDEQLEVRHVISLAHHTVSIYSGGDKTPEGELFIKRNALCLTRKLSDKGLAADTVQSKPFFLFSENCSAKEDFYFSLIRNQEQFGSQNGAPQPLRYDVKNIISLVQKLHSTEEHAHTRWLNAFLGRIFLSIHKTKDVENFITEKLTKKISRVSRPSFLTKVSIRKIDTGDSAPYFTNLQLKNLNVEGETVLEADVKYTGNFRIEVSAVARIDLGTRLKARDITLILAVVLKKLEGHVFFKIKPPPSNRVWFSFQSMPKIEMAIEPIVSSRQITYGVILRQIESRIKEVIAETLVSPFWDDMPFFNTEHKDWRGGIFEGDDAVEHSEDYEEIAAQLGNVEEVSRVEAAETASLPKSPPRSPELVPMEKSHTLPVTDTNQSPGFWNLKFNSKRTSTNGMSHGPSASTTALDVKGPAPSASETPRFIRSGSFSISNPVVGTDNAHADTFRPSSSPPDRDDAFRAMSSISARSPVQAPVDSPAKTPPSMSLPVASSHNSSSETIPEEPDTEKTPVAPPRRDTASSAESIGTDHMTNSPATSTKSVFSGTASIGRSFFARKDTASSATSANSMGNTPDNKKNTLAAVSNAAKWGWNAIQRPGDKSTNTRKLSLSDPNMTVDLNQPMGRGQPLPPPGVPLPRPGEKPNPIPVPKRKPAPVPAEVRQSTETVDIIPNERRRSSTNSMKSTRRRRISQNVSEGNEENILIVEAPDDSAPPTPSVDATVSYVQPWAEDADELDGKESQGNSTAPPSEPPVTEDTEQHVDKGIVNDSAVEAEEEDGYANWMEDEATEKTEAKPESMGQSEVKQSEVKA